MKPHVFSGEDQCIHSNDLRRPVMVVASALAQHRKKARTSIGMIRRLPGLFKAIGLARQDRTEHPPPEERRGHGSHSQLTALFANEGNLTPARSPSSRPYGRCE